MDLAHMIIKQSEKLQKDEEDKRKLKFELSIKTQEKEYIYSMILGIQAGNKPNRIYMIFNNIKFISAKNGHATRRNLKAILSQMLRQYIKESGNEVIFEDEIHIKFSYKDKAVFEDSHFVDGDIVEESLSMSPQTDHDRDVCRLMSFLFCYFEMFIDAEFC